MEEIDTFIKRLKDEQEMKDYLEQNIYPPSLKSTTRPIIYHTPLDEIKSKPIKCINITDDLQFTSNLFNKLNTLERQIKDSIDLENKENVVVNENDCPICFENIGDSNYLVHLVDIKYVFLVSQIILNIINLMLILVVCVGKIYYRIFKK